MPWKWTSHLYLPILEVLASKLVIKTVQHTSKYIMLPTQSVGGGCICGCQKCSFCFISTLDWCHTKAEGQWWFYNNMLLIFEVEALQIRLFTIISCVQIPVSWYNHISVVPFIFLHGCYFLCKVKDIVRWSHVLNWTVFVGPLW